MKASHKEVSGGGKRAPRNSAAQRLAAGLEDEFNRSKKRITVNLLF
jgi:hypothetical protein